ncbi:MAG: UDP-N-acetylmuramate--L-alanine ligase [Candidatus Bipolaricaulia bacterium]
MSNEHRSVHYYFIGIGGDGMSGLAQILLEQGARVSGSNIEENSKTEELRCRGVRVHIGHWADHLADGADVDMVVVSSAIREDNIELVEARSLGIPILKRLEMLAQLMKSHRSIGITGTHGKTTTTTMASMLLEHGGFDPTFLIGGESDELGGNAKLGAGEYLVAEVDESDGYFLTLEPYTVVVTNIDRDHLNHYRDERALRRSFTHFIEKVPDDGRAILCYDDSYIREIIRKLSRPYLSFGIVGNGDRHGEADLVAEEIRRDRLETWFRFSFRGETYGEVKLPIPGRHNVYNALAAMLVGWEVGMSFAEMAAILENFAPPQRRFQLLNQTNGRIVVDDYAHLPAEIEANLEAIREGWKGVRLIAIFQPHRFTRTQYINGRFGSSFDLADTVIVTDIYPAFEDPIPGINASIIVNSIAAHGHDRVHYIPDQVEIFDYLKQHSQSGDFIISFGAGDIWKVTQQFANHLKHART